MLNLWFRVQDGGYNLRGGALAQRHVEASSSLHPVQLRGTGQHQEPAAAARCGDERHPDRAFSRAAQTAAAEPSRRYAPPPSVHIWATERPGGDNPAHAWINSIELSVPGLVKAKHVRVCPCSCLFVLEYDNTPCFCVSGFSPACPPGVDPIIWEQAKVDNPDPER